MPKVAASARDAFIETRRNELLDVALRVFASQGFDAATVDDIASEAGISKGTVYLYFPSKEAILDELVSRYSVMEDVLKLSDELRSLPIERGVQALIATSWRILKERADLVRLLLQIPFRPQSAKFLMERVILPANTLVADYLKGSGRADKRRRLEAFLLARCFFGMLLGFFVTQELFGGNELSPLSDEQITSAITRVMNAALAARRPLEGLK